MKKLLCLVLSLAVVLSMVACGGKSGAGEKPGDTMSLQEIVEAVEKDVPDLPGTMSMELTDDIFEYFAFTAPRDGVEGIAADALINATAHSLVIVRAADEKTAQEMAKEMDANKDPRKWICSEAEKSEVIVHGSTIMLVMSFEDVTDAMVKNFNALWD